MGLSEVEGWAMVFELCNGTASKVHVNVIFANLYLLSTLLLLLPYP